MRTNQRITLAYCVELDEVIPIVRARGEYFRQEHSPRTRYEFLCSSPECRNGSSPAKITAVNYYIFPDDEASFQLMHFRDNPHTEHDPACQWIDDVAEANRALTVSEDEVAKRTARAHLHDFIEVFDPDRRSETDTETHPASDSSSRQKDDGSAKPGIRHGSATPAHRTGSFERLVEYYREAARLPKDIYHRLTLRTPEMGVVPLRTYFVPVRFAVDGMNKRVLMGGARLRRYGRGFSLLFFDEIDDKSVSLYVSSTEVIGFRYRRYLEELLDKAVGHKYVRAYLRGTRTESDKGFALKANDLRDLVLFLGPSLEGEE